MFFFSQPAGAPVTSLMKVHFMFHSDVQCEGTACMWLCDLHYVSVLYAGNIYTYIFMSLSFQSTKLHSLTTLGAAQQLLKCSLMDSPPGRCCGKLWLILRQCCLYWRLARWMLNVPVCTMHLGTAQPLYPFPLQPRLENIHELATLY